MPLKRRTHLPAVEVMDYSIDEALQVYGGMGMYAVETGIEMDTAIPAFFESTRVPTKSTVCCHRLNSVDVSQKQKSLVYDQRLKWSRPHH